MVWSLINYRICQWQFRQLFQKLNFICDIRKYCQTLLGLNDILLYLHSVTHKTVMFLPLLTLQLLSNFTNLL